MNFAKNIKKRRLELGLTQEQLAHACGWPGQSRVANYEKGLREPTINDIQTLAKVLQIEVSALFGDISATGTKINASKYHVVSSDDDDSGIPIKFSDIRGSCGGGAINGDELDRSPLIKEPSWFKRYKIKPKDALAVWADGDSMSEYIVDGDIAIFDTSKKLPKSGCIYLVQHPDGTKIKKLRLGIDGSWILESNNPDKRKFPDEKISPDQAELLIILGEFVYRQGG